MSGAPTLANVDPPATPTGVGSLAPEPPFHGPSWRAVVGVLAVTVVLTGIAYPAAANGFANLVSPSPAMGAPPGTINATAYASELIGQNITNASLFWLRPSLLDWQATLGSGESPLGPTDPALLNVTKEYIALYGLTNTTAPFSLVSPSESGFDPDLTPEAALVQVPRVATASHLSESTLTLLVEGHIVQPLFGFLGPAYVNVIDLDRALLAMEHPGGGA